eukprot:1369656-Pyramimonas_sp.AAC.1
MDGTEGAIDRSAKCVEDSFGKRTNDGHGSGTHDQCENSQQLRRIQHRGLTGVDAEAKAPKMVTDMFASLRGALA